MVWEDISVKQAQISVFGSAFLFCDKMHELTNLLFREKLKGEKQYLEVNIEIKLADRSNFTDFSMDSFDRLEWSMCLL